MNQLNEIRAEAEYAQETVWFLRSIEEIERTDFTISLRLHIRRGLFVQVFYGEKSGSLYMALVEGRRRVFGIDREAGQWHIHPFEDVEKHLMMSHGLEPKPILKFLARVEEILLDNEML